jgi:hypothetical protein
MFLSQITAPGVVPVALLTTCLDALETVFPVTVLFAALLLFSETLWHEGGQAYADGFCSWVDLQCVIANLEVKYVGVRLNALLINSVRITKAAIAAAASTSDISEHMSASGDQQVLTRTYYARCANYCVLVFASEGEIVSSICMSTCRRHLTRHARQEPIVLVRYFLCARL